MKQIVEAFKGPFSSPANPAFAAPILYTLDGVSNDPVGEEWINMTGVELTPEEASRLTLLLYDADQAKLANKGFEEFCQEHLDLTPAEERAVRVMFGLEVGEQSASRPVQESPRPPRRRTSVVVDDDDDDDKAAPPVPAPAPSAPPVPPVVTAADTTTATAAPTAATPAPADPEPVAPPAPPMVPPTPPAPTVIEAPVVQPVQKGGGVPWGWITFGVVLLSGLFGCGGCTILGVVLIAVFGGGSSVTPAPVVIEGAADPTPTGQGGTSSPAGSGITERECRDYWEANVPAPPACSQWRR